jgi:hypothetical protein
VVLLVTKALMVMLGHQVMQVLVVIPLQLIYLQPIHSQVVRVVLLAILDQVDRVVLVVLQVMLVLKVTMVNLVIQAT